MNIEFRDNQPKVALSSPLLTLCVIAAVASAPPAYAVCTPATINADFTTVVCTGIETEPVISLFNSTTVQIDESGIVQGVNSPIIFLEGLNQRVFNDGLITGINVLAGAAIDGPGGVVVNSGIVDIDEGIGYWLEGTGSRVTNLGSIRMSGFGAEGVFIDGANASIINNNQVTINGNQAEALTIDGILGAIINEGTLDVTGNATSGLIVDGQGSGILNAGRVTMNGQATIAAGGAGLSVTVENTGILQMIGDGGIAMGIVGDDLTLNNAATITTSGRFSLGMVGAGLSSTLPALPNMINQAGGTITTNGPESAAMVLGLDELTIPPGVAIPLPVGLLLNPAQGHMRNAGQLNTVGAGSDGMRGFANDSLFTNSGGISVLGDGSAGIHINGTDNEVINLSQIEAGSDSSELSVGISFEGGTVQVTNEGDVSASGMNSAGIRGTTNATATVANDATIAASGPGAQGVSATGVGASSRVVVDNNAGAEVTVTGDNSTGLQATGVNVVVRNGGAVNAAGANSTATLARLATTDADLLLENANEISATGNGTIGMHVQSSFSEPTGSLPVVVERAAVSAAGCANGEASMVNCGTVRVSGEQASAMRVDGNSVQVANDGALQLASGQTTGVLADGDGTRVDNTGSISGVDANGAAIITNQARGVNFSGADNQVNNSGVISFQGADSFGIRGTQAEGAQVVNTGVLVLEGAGARGIDVAGDEVMVINGGADAAQIALTQSTGGAGIAVSGQGAFVSNRRGGEAALPELQVSGNNSTGIDVAAIGSGAYLVENDGFASVSGNDSVGLALRSTTNTTLGGHTANLSGTASCLGAPTASAINCGTLAVSGDRSTGMAVLGMAGVYVENSGQISATAADGAMGLVVGRNALNASSNNNLILNLDDITAGGNSAKGVVIEGDGNRFIHGQGALALPVADALFPDTFEIFSTQLERDSSTQDVPVFPVAGIVVDGPNSVGVEVTGNNNVVALLPVAQPNGLVAAAVIASGADSVGVSLSGDNNRLLNQGHIEGQTAIRGGEGRDFVQNVGAIIGGAQLGGGDDRFEMAPQMAGGPAFQGTFDGGAGTDTLQVNAINYSAIATNTAASINGNQFVRFENFLLSVAPTSPVGSDYSILGNNLVTLENTLALTADVGSQATLGPDSTLRLAPGALLSADRVVLQDRSVLTGNGAVGRRPTGPGGLDTSVVVLEGASVLAGDSPGRIDFLTDLEFAGFLEIEIAGITDSLFDMITVDGDLTFLGGEIRFEFIDGYVPDIGDTFDFLDVTGAIFGFDTVDFSVGGLLDPFNFGLSLDNGGLRFNTLAMEPAAVPEPGTMALLALGLLILWHYRRRRY